MLITIAVIAIVAFVGFVVNVLRHKKIHKRGVETDAVVSCVREIECKGQEAQYECFVQYRNDAGEIVEAKLGNPPHALTEGTTLRVKYLPENPNYALIVKR